MHVVCAKCASCKHDWDGEYEHEDRMHMLSEECSKCGDTREGEWETCDCGMDDREYEPNDAIDREVNNV